MKRTLLFFSAILIATGLLAQHRVTAPAYLRNKALPYDKPVNSVRAPEKPFQLPELKNSTIVDETIIGTTRYDLQSNSSMQNRVHYYSADGTAAGVWTMGFADPSFPGRGTGYNYYDGSAWGDPPTERIESIRTGWPSYAPFGDNGELVVSHDFSAGELIVLTRDEKGTGDWTEMNLPGPDGIQISWNRSTTSGTDHSVIQVLCITWPTANGGPVYQGLDGALLYSRSTDGGVTWDPQHAILDGISSNYYSGFSADDYEWAASKGDMIAFLTGSSWTDLVLMKSADGGDTWEKTVIWEHPYPFFNPASPIVTDTFYCVDGDHHLAFDSQGKVHVVFGINRAYSDGSGTFWFPFVDGLAYWNEDMPTFSNDVNALNPYGDPASELVEDETLIGWAQDVNGNGEWDVLDDIGTYYVGASSMPQIVIDDMDYIYVVFSSVTEGYHNEIQNYRHLWGRGSWADITWGDFVDLTGDFIHSYDECVFPSIASETTDEKFFLLYQTDSEPGLAVRGDEDPYTDNNINFMEVLRSELIPVGVDENIPVISGTSVSQNRPNPAGSVTWIDIELNKAAEVVLKVEDLSGRIVYQSSPVSHGRGILRLAVDVADWTPGIYIYTVQAGNQQISRKMSVQ